MSNFLSHNWAERIQSARKRFHASANGICFEGVRASVCLCVCLCIMFEMAKENVCRHSSCHLTLFRFGRHVKHARNRHVVRCTLYIVHTHTHIQLYTVYPFCATFPFWHMEGRAARNAQK